MKKILILLFMTASVATSFAQFGVRGTYSNVRASNWEQAIKDNLESDGINLNQIGFGMDYWFRLKKQRIEFMPTLKYASSNTSISSQVDNFSRVSDFQSVGLQWNTHIYFLDFKGDCDCPTWSKNKPWVEKGLFFFVSPGFDYQTLNYTAMNEGDIDVIFESKSSDFNVNIGAGLGLDIGLSDLITLTPYAGVRFHNTIEWVGFLSDIQPINPVSSKMREIYGGLRLGIRFND